MDLGRIARDTATVLVNYLTYQAVRVVIDQLSETDPPVAMWLQQFSANYSFQQAEAYLMALMQARQPLALRIMTVRESIADDVAGVLPEMVRSSVQQANLEQRRQMFERMTRPISSPDGSSEHLEIVPESDNGDAPQAESA